MESRSGIWYADKLMRSARRISKPSAHAADPKTWQLETWNLKIGTCNLELDTWDLEVDTCNWDLEQGTWNFVPIFLRRTKGHFPINDDLIWSGRIWVALVGSGRQTI